MTKSELMEGFLETLCRLSLLTDMEATWIYHQRNRIRGLDVN
jgi:hypothetical protein